MIIKTLELVEQDLLDPNDDTKYFPGASIQLTTCTQGFPDITVLAMSGTGMAEPVSFTLAEVRAMHQFLGDIVYGQDDTP